jgi:exonuclease III
MDQGPVHRPRFTAAGAKDNGGDNSANTSTNAVTEALANAASSNISSFDERHPKPIIWTGDLNVSHRKNDGTHPDFFSGQKSPGTKGSAVDKVLIGPNDSGHR